MCAVERFGGIKGNEALTSVAAVALIALLLAEGITIIDMGGLLTLHMVVGLVLIPPVLVKLGSTGYRFARYYLRTPAYREKGPPLMALRLLGPVLVVTTLLVFATGVALLILGHKSNALLEVHKVSFIVWGVLFGVHVLAHLRDMARSLRSDWSVPGARIRLTLLATSIVAGLTVALAVLPSITHWHGGHHSG
jgi:hypothetical protein